ncbi:MAG: LytTR family DNA-binding domain-containing protein [Gelidibacter sp.]
MKLNCVIIEDEPLARKGLEGFVRKLEQLVVVGSFSNPLKALECFKTEQIDVLFLDIKMPEMTGLAFLKTLEHPPAVVITTAYPNYAVQGFELNVVDYLLKPFSFDRFVMAVNKVMKRLEPSGHKEDDFMFIKCDNKIEKIMFADILFVQAMENYVIIHTESKKYVSYLTLKSVEDFLPENLFVKIHKSYIVSLQKIDAIEGQTVLIRDHRIKFSKNNKEEVLNLITKNRFLKR